MARFEILDHLEEESGEAQHILFIPDFEAVWEGLHSICGLITTGKFQVVYGVKACAASMCLDIIGCLLTLSTVQKDDGHRTNPTL